MSLERARRCGWRGSPYDALVLDVMPPGTTVRDAAGRASASAGAVLIDRSHAVTDRGTVSTRAPTTT